MIYVTLRANDETGFYTSTASRDGVLEWKDIPTSIEPETADVAVVCNYITCLAIEMGVEAHEILMVPLSMQPLDQVP